MPFRTINGQGDSTAWQSVGFSSIAVQFNFASLDLAISGTSYAGLSAGAFKPATNDIASLGTTTLGWSDLHLATGALINVANGNAVITHSSGVFTVSTGDFRVTTAGTNSASVATVGGTQTLTNKTISGSSNTITNISLSTGVTGTLPIANGGTGETTLQGAWTRRPLIYCDDDFMGGNTSDGTTGQQGWRTYAGSGTGSIAYIDGAGSAFGVLEHTTGTTSGNSRINAFYPNSTNIVTGLNSLLFETLIRFKLASSASIGIHCGWIGGAFGTEDTNNAIKLRYDTGSGDANFMAVCRSGGSETATSLGVAADTNWHTIRIWSESAGTIKFRLYTAAGVAEGNEITISTNVPSAAITPLFATFTRTSSAKACAWDCFKFSVNASR